MTYKEQVRRATEQAICVAFTLEKVDGGYKIKREHGKGFFSKKPMSRAKAKRQLAVIEMHKHGG